MGLVYAVTIVTAQSDEDGPPPRYPTYDECMYWENDHEYCEHLLPPTYTPTATATHTHTPTPTDTPTPTNTPTPTPTPTPNVPLYDDWEDCIATETEEFCKRWGSDPPGRQIRLRP